MSKSVYEVSVARNETVVYTIKVEANNEKDAEKKAWDKYQKGYWDYEDTVFGEEEIHEINYRGEIENA